MQGCKEPSFFSTKEEEQMRPAANDILIHSLSLQCRERVKATTRWKSTWEKVNGKDRSLPILKHRTRKTSRKGNTQAKFMTK